MSGSRDAGGSRLHVSIQGAVQGVGFRPFVYRLARELGLKGWVRNSPQGVEIDAEGPSEALAQLLPRLQYETPPLAAIYSLESAVLDPRRYETFEVRESETGGAKAAVVLPDVATCRDCLADILDTANRRFRYPFTNCTNCGPRFTIIEALPYDRANTTMRAFTMCARCRAEYDNPADRRFHAQPNACPDCGPHLEIRDGAGNALAKRGKALLDAAAALGEGKIVAVKGLGGFHLMVVARDATALARLRRLKQREEKPFALMYPSLAAVREDCRVDAREERLLTSPAAPIVLLRRHSLEPHPAVDCAGAAAANPYLGVMLPSTPLHHLLLRELGAPVVATSGNVSDETICIDENEALERLRGMADLFLVHNRPILRHADDSIARIAAGREQVLRRARGYAPLPISLPRSAAGVLAVGAHLKNTVAIGVGKRIHLSQHIGDLETEQTHGAFTRIITDLERLYDFAPTVVAHDRHPNYLSTQYAQRLARERGVPAVPVQHHFAHVLSCMADNELEGEVLGVAWDGVGYGPDGTAWGGEFLRTDGRSYTRTGHLRQFRLPGGDAAVREPRRSALGLLYEMHGKQLLEQSAAETLSAFSETELPALITMLKKELNAPLTSSAGRLFDAVASLIGVRQRCHFEGQAAMELEFLADAFEEEAAEPYEISLSENAGESIIVNWPSAIENILRDKDGGVERAVIAARFHATLVEAIVGVARMVGVPRVLLTGGCFQNARLTAVAVHRLRESGFQPYWHQRVPPNDGGIALGQAVAATLR